jgi:hypothetical protein
VTATPTLPVAHGIRRLGQTDLEGSGDGGQIQVIERRGRRIAYVGHMGTSDQATSIVDVTDPRRPRLLRHIPKATPATHSHKVQVCGDLMLINHEKLREVPGPYKAGVGIYDLQDPAEPRELGFYPTGGTGVHRMWFQDGRFAHIASGAEGYRDNLYLILDLQDPAAPREAGRWHIPGTREDEPDPRRPGEGIRVHHIVVHETRAYVACWDAGMAVVDISTHAAPRTVALRDWSPPYGGCTHTVLPLPARALAVVVDEAIRDHCEEGQKMVWVVDLREETNPTMISTFPVPEGDFCARGGVFGPHNVHEPYTGSFASDTLVYLTCYNAGVRIVDLANPYRPVEVAWYIPEPPAGSPKGAPQVNDIYVARDGLIYATDRYTGGLYMLERT